MRKGELLRKGTATALIIGAVLLGQDAVNCEKDSNRLVNRENSTYVQPGSASNDQEKIEIFDSTVDMDIVFGLFFLASSAILSSEGVCRRLIEASA